MTDGIRPYFFGDATSRLFACHHSPRGGASQHGVVLCNPIGHEYVRTHRVYRLLADRLARAGVHVLRFDYYGTGDSPGEYEEASLRRWVDDSVVAAEELRRRYGVSHVLMAGLRMGATLAMMSGAEHGGLSGVVLWDPVVNGPEYLAEVIAVHRETVRSSTGERASEPKDAESPRELVGFPISESLLDELRRVDLFRLARSPAPSALLVDSAEEPQQQRLRTYLESAGLHAQYEHVPNPRPWTRNPYKMLLPNTILDTVVAWISAQKQ